MTNDSRCTSSKAALRSLAIVFLFVFSLLVFQSEQLSFGNFELSTTRNSSPEEIRDKDKNQSCSSPTAEAKISQIIRRLTQSPMPRYYVYEDDRFKARNRIRGFKKLRWSYQGFADVEEHIISVLANSSLRTKDPEQAELFFVPISLTRHIIERPPGHTSAEVFNVLYNQTFFQSNQGNRHFMIVQMPNLWSYEHMQLYRDRSLCITQQYPKLWNVTIGKVFDQEGCEEANKKGLLEGNDYKYAMLDLGFAMSRSSFSLNFIPSPRTPFVRASMEKFRNSTWDCFYYSVNGASVFNSTQYRHALLKEAVWNALPRSSIGFDISPPQWIEHFQSSRFCLVIRGDNPASRSQLRAVKVGCIPVIVSNLLEYYAPTFKSSIAMSDYTIMIDEDEFLADPVSALLKLNNLSEEVICEKLEYLALAQRLFLSDHPESLFVPALLHEVTESIKRASNHTHGPW